MDIKNYCVLPFNSVSITASGEIRHCCNGGHDVSGTQRIENLTVDELINNPFIHDIRDAFLKEEKHPACARCWKMEDMGILSFREVANQYKNYAINETGIRTFKRELDFEDIEYIDLTLGNKCNLACRMCNATSSSLFAKQDIELGFIQGPAEIDHDDDAKQKILELFRRSVNLKNIYMLGGEPLIHPFHFEILDLLIETGQAKNIEIFFNTNFQVNKVSSFMDRWEHFKTVHIQASIDGTEDTYNYIRWPGNWNKLYRNLNDLGEIVDNKKYKLSISPVLQNLNVHNIFDLINQCNIIKNKELGMFFIPVSGLNKTEIVPKEIIAKAMEDISSLPKRKSLPKPDLLRQLQTAYDAEYNPEHVEEFFRKTKAMDEYRKQNLFETMPHFSKLADDFGIKKW